MIEAWKIGIALSMTSNHSKVIQDLLLGLGLVEARIAKLAGKEGFGRLQVAAAGVATALAGGAIVKGLVDVIEATKDLNDELVKLQNTGMGQANVDRMMKTAIATTNKVKGITYEQALRAGRETYGLVGMEDAVAMNETEARLIKSLNFSKKGSGEEGLFRLLRSGDIMGQLTDPTTKKVDIGRLTAFLDVVQKFNQMSGGTVTPDTWLGMAKTGGLSLTGLSKEGIETMAMTAQIMGGPRAGTAMMSLHQQLAGGTMYKRTAEAMEKLGLLGKGEWNTEGGHVSISDEASQRLSGQLGEDPLKWVTETLIPAMVAKGITDPQAQQRMIFRILGRQTTQRFAGEWVRNSWQGEQERARVEMAAGIGKAGENQDAGSITQNLANITASWHKLLDSFGGPQAKNFNLILGLISDNIDKMTAHLQNLSPETIKNTGIAIAALGAAILAIGAGTVLLAISPLVGVGGLIAGLATALVLLGKSPWKTIIDDLDNLEKSVEGWGQKLRNFFTNGGVGSPGGNGIIPQAYHPGGGGFSSGPSGLHGGGGYSVGPVTSGNITSRAGIAAQLADPNTRLAVAAMLDLEGTPQATAESLYNRSSYANMSLMHMLHSGFYGPINHGMLPGKMAALLRNPKRLAALNAAINAALSSDIIHGATDQGMFSDPNGHWLGGRTIVGGQVFNDWGGGPGGHAGAARWRQAFEASSRAHVDIGIPQIASGGNDTHIHMMIDGHKVAHGVLKHFTGMGNRPTSGGRLSDISMTRPLGN